MALAASLIMMTACGDKQAKTAQNTNNQTNTIVEEKIVEAKTDTIVEKEIVDDTAKLEKNEEPIVAIRNVWASKPISIVAAEGTTDLERCAVAFCKEYSIYTPNKVLYDYFKSPKQFEKDEEELGFNYGVENQKEEGYILCRAQVQCSWDTDCRCWKRDNGHSLVAFWMVDNNEQSDGDKLLVFYDYDPKTGTMTPDLTTPKKLDVITAKYNGGYNVRLDDPGVNCFIDDEEKDYYESHYYLIRWDGNNISLELEEE